MPLRCYVPLWSNRLARLYVSREDSVRTLSLKFRSDNRINYSASTNGERTGAACNSAGSRLIANLSLRPKMNFDLGRRRIKEHHRLGYARVLHQSPFGRLRSVFECDRQICPLADWCISPVQRKLLCFESLEAAFIGASLPAVWHLL